MDGSTGVHIEGITAFVTGANRGLGKAFVQELLDRGARKVYAAARDTDTIDISVTSVSFRCGWTSPALTLSSRPPTVAETYRW